MANILEQFDSEDFADNKIIVAYELKLDVGGVRNIGKHCGKKIECWLSAILLFPQSF